MIVQCDKCARHFDVPEAALLPNGRKLKCAGCGHIFFQAVSGSETERVSVEDQDAVKIVQTTATQSASFVKNAHDAEEGDLLEGFYLEDDFAEDALTDADEQEWATLPTDLQEVDLDGDPELSKLAADVGFPDDFLSGPAAARQEPRLQEEPPLDWGDKAEAVALSRAETNRWATSASDLQEIDVDNDPELANSVLFPDEFEQEADNKWQEPSLGQEPTGDAADEQGAMVLSHAEKEGEERDDDPEEGGMGNDMDRDLFLDELEKKSSGKRQEPSLVQDLPDDAVDEDGITVVAGDRAGGWMAEVDDLREIDLDGDPELRDLQAMDEMEHDLEEENLWSDEDKGEDEGEDEDDAGPLLPGKKREPEPRTVHNLEPEVEEEEKEEEALDEERIPDLFPKETSVAKDGEKQSWHSSKKAWALVALLLLTLGIGVGVRNQQWSGSTGVTGVSGSSVTATDYNLLPVEGYWKKYGFGELLLLQGKISNVSSTTSSMPPVVQISLVDKENKVLLTAQVVPGRVVDKAVLQDSGERAIREMISLQGQKRTGSDVTWADGKELPFQAMFINPPPEVVHFRVDFK